MKCKKLALIHGKCIITIDGAIKIAMGWENRFVRHVHELLFQYVNAFQNVPIDVVKG